MQLENGTENKRTSPNGSSSTTALKKAGLAGVVATNGASQNGISKKGKGSTLSPSFAPPDPRLQSPDYFGHSREEVTRIIIQSLVDLGYTSTAAQLEEESEYSLETVEVSNFRKAVLRGEWTRAEALMGELDISRDADQNALLFDLRQQKFLELLEQGNQYLALDVLRRELAPLNHDVLQLHFLSSLMMLSPEDLKVKADWDGAQGTSRHELLRALSMSISPSVMIPEHRLASLLTQVKQSQISKCLYHNTANSPSLYSDHVCDRNQFPLSTVKILRLHDDEVWYARFSHDGTKLATASKDKKAIIWDVETFEPLHILAEHEQGVAYLSWSPYDDMLITCSHDKTARLWNTETGTCIHVLTPHTEPVTSCAWAPDGQTFVTGSMDGDIIVWDLNATSQHKWQGSRIFDLEITPDGQWLVAICTMKRVHIYNFVTRKKEFQIEMEASLTSISVSKDSRYIIMNMMTEEVQIWDLATLELVRRFKGHRQGEYIIKSCFGGNEENFVVSGSEDSCIYVWHKDNGILMEKLAGHSGTVNCVSWSPTNPHMFASTGDDHEVRIWSIASYSDSKGKGRESPEHIL